MMRWKLLSLLLSALVLLAFLLLETEGSDYKKVIAVYNSKNEAIPSCLVGADKEYSISELSSIVTNDTLVRICSSVLVMTKNITFSAVSHVGLVGYDYPTLQCFSDSKAGLTFTAIKNLDLRNFVLNGCGLMTDIDADPTHNIMASLTILMSTNITVMDIAIYNGSGSGLAMFYNNGSIEIGNSTFENNGRDRLTGGNGVYIESGPPISNNSLANGLTANYVISYCTFSGNVAATGKDNFIKGFSRFDKGGGLCLYVLASEWLNVTVTNSTFVRNEAEHYGGGFYATFIGKSRNNNILVMYSEFVENRGRFGGGSYSGYLHTRRPVLQTPLNSSHLYKSVSFANNDAEFGGGSSIFSTKTLANDSSALVLFEDCVWMKNTGQYGSAITVLPNAWNLYDEGYLPTPRFAGCRLQGNQVKAKSIYTQQNYHQYLKGSGAFYCFGHNVLFEKVNSFLGNRGSALYLGSCLGLFIHSSETTFIDNQGYQGGAIYQLSSVLYIHNNAKVHFIGNHATDKGGAIYQHTFFMHIFDYSKTCFIDYNDNIENVADRNISVNFDYNSAGHSGHSIYASSLRPCYNRFSFSAANLSVDIFNQVGNFTYFPPDRSQEIATAINHSIITDKSWSGIIEIIPGKESVIPFFDIDDLNQKVTTNYLVTIDGDSPRKANITTNEHYLEVSSNILRLYGPPHSNATVTLSDTTSRQMALSFLVAVQPCPPGFIQDSELQSCICSDNTKSSYVGVANCNLTLMRAHRKRGYWLGYKPNSTEGEDTLMSGYCPQGFCFYNHIQLLPGSADRVELNQAVCSESRTGILCGQCKENFSVYFHSSDFKCKSDKLCTWGWAFYLLSEIVPVTIVFLIIIFFNVPFTSGIINGFIFYCQVVETLQVTAGGLIPFSAAAQLVNKIHSLVYAAFALDFFVLDELSFCLWKGADAITVIAFNYATLVYALFLVILVTLFVRKFQFSRLSRYATLGSHWSNFQGSIIHGMSAFIIICYAQCVRSAVLLLSSSKIYYKGEMVSEKVVYYNGEIQWMSLHHMPYAIPAIVSSFFIVILPPILLIIYPLHYKVLSFMRIAESECAKTLFSPLERFKPFFDSFQGCFKDEFRFFSGLYFVYRFFIMFNAVISYLKDSFVILEIQLIVMLIFHSLCHPYKKRLHNMMDTLLFGNLAIINAISYYNFSSVAADSSYNNSITVWIQSVLIMLPLPLMGCYLVSKLPFTKKCCLKHKSESDIDNEDVVPVRLNYGACDDIVPELRES